LAVDCGVLRRAQLFRSITPLRDDVALVHHNQRGRADLSRPCLGIVQPIG
jgi:hypothetical protein